jgi:hypothetical protein
MHVVLRARSGPTDITIAHRVVLVLLLFWPRARVKRNHSRSSLGARAVDQTRPTPVSDRTSERSTIGVPAQLSTSGFTPPWRCVTKGGILTAPWFRALPMQLTRHSGC